MWKNVYVTSRDREWKRSNRTKDQPVAAKAKACASGLASKQSQKVYDMWKDAVKFQWQAKNLNEAFVKTTFNAFLSTMHFNHDDVNEKLLEVMKALKDPNRGIYMSVTGTNRVKYVSLVYRDLSDFALRQHMNLVNTFAESHVHGRKGPYLGPFLRGIVELRVC